MWLTVITGRDAGKVVELAGGRVLVGTRRGCDLVLRDPGVSPVHAAFHPLEGGGYAVEDLGSENGTFVETKRIERPQRVAGTEQLCFGETFAVLSLERPASARARRRRAPRPAVAAVLLALAAAGVTAAVLGPLAGGGEDRGALHVVAPSAAAGSQPLPTTAAAAATTGAATAEPATTAPPAGLLVAFRDGFADPASGWEQTSGRAATAGYEAGRYVVTIRDPTYFVTADSGRAFPQPLVSVTVTNSDPAAYAGFGIVCGYRRQLEFYALAAGTDGTAAILHEHDGKLDVLSDGGRWAPTPAVRPGAGRHRLRARCDTDRLTLWVDGRRAASARVHGVTGRVGLFAAGRVRLAFDDVVVRVP